MPYAKWHGRDWLGDHQLRMVGPECRGVWIDMLCVMMQCEPYGHLAVNGRPMTDEEVSLMIGLDLKTYKGNLLRLEKAGIPSRLPDGTIFSRRLVRDYARFLAGSVSGRRGGGNPALRASDQEELRSQNPEAKGALKVTYIGAIDGDEKIGGRFLSRVARLRAGHDDFSRVHDFQIANILQGWPEETWDDAIETLIRMKAGAVLAAPCQTLNNFLAGKPGKPTSAKPGKTQTQLDLEETERNKAEANR